MSFIDRCHRKVTNMNITSDGQMVLPFDDAFKVTEASSKVYPEVVFDFDELFSEPLTEENMKSNNSIGY